MSRDEAVKKYAMTEEESKAYEICLIWLSLTAKMFPSYSNKGLGKGDPRKSLLFKYGYKLYRETRGLIPDYFLYVKAQLDILRAIRIGDVGTYIGPHVIVGDKAWIRWKVWQKKFVSQAASIRLDDVGLDKTDEAKVEAELTQTKTFLEGRFGDKYQEHCVRMAKSDIARWVAMEKVSPFYAILSPWARRYCSFSDVFDEGLYKSSITPQIEAKFKELFLWEFLASSLN